MRSSKRVFPQTIEHLSVAGSDAIISFAGVRTINEALRLVGCSLWADGPAAGRDTAEPGAGVLGFRVFDLQGECWGTVKAQPHFSLNQVLEIEDAATGETVYVPWHDSLVVKIDRRASTMRHRSAGGTAGTEPVKFSIITIFPDLVRNFLGYGLLEKAVQNGLVAGRCPRPARVQPQQAPQGG